MEESFEDLDIKEDEGTVVRGARSCIAKLEIALILARGLGRTSADAINAIKFIESAIGSLKADARL